MTLKSVIATVAVTGLVGFAQTTAPRPISTRVPVENLVDITGSVSRDGRYLSFVGPTGLSLLDLTTNQIRTVVRISDTDDSIPWNSTISPDASMVAYSRMHPATNREAVWVASLTGDANPRQVFAEVTIRSVMPRDWSPDGKWIAAIIKTDDFKYQLALVPTDAGKARVLKTGQWSGSSRVFFSPDGKYLLYDMLDPNWRTRDIWVTAVDLSKDHGVVTNRANDIVMGWAPDGDSLLFASDRLGSNALWSVPIRDGTVVRPPVLVKPDIGSSQSMGVTAAGALFTVTNYFRVGSIMAGTFDFTTGAVHAARDVSTDPGEDNVNPTWSPDGKYLAYVAWRSRPIVPIVVLRMADTGAVVREIEPQMRDATLADWHPDGKSLLMFGHDFNGKHGAFRVDVETGAASHVYAIPERTPGASLPVWSRDGRSLYYWNTTAAGDQVIIARNVQSGAETELVRRPSLSNLLVSPDGLYVVTATTDRATKEYVLLLVPLDGTATRDLIRRPPAESLGPMAWTPDSQAVVMRLNPKPDTPSERWLVPVNGSAPRKLPALHDANTFKFTVTQDGRRAAYRVKELDLPPLPQIWKLENFLRK